jgi:hypothetical protein
MDVQLLRIHSLEVHMHARETTEKGGKIWGGRQLTVGEWYKVR